MKFKTTIKIITNAANKDEAADMAGEYLSGNVTGNVRMTCKTAPALDAKKCAAIASVFIFVFVGVAAFGLHMKTTAGTPQVGAGFSAVQPPLKTAVTASKDEKFKNEWQERQTKESLGRITK